MNAVISGQSGVAVLVDGSRLASIQADSDGEVVDRRPQEIRFLLNDARDLEFVEDIEPEEVVRRLEVATSKYDALHTALILLDRELSHDTRRTAAEELDELLADATIEWWVECVLYAHPLPRSGDLEGARSACTGRTNRTRALLDRLRALQWLVAEVYQAWNRIAEIHFRTAEERQWALSTAVKEGLFRNLVKIRAAGNPVKNFLLSSVSNPALQQVGITEDVLRWWLAGLSSSTEQFLAIEPDISFVAEAAEDDQEG